MLFTLDDATESMERESLDVWIACATLLFPLAGYCLVLLLALFFLYILFVS